MQLDSDSADGKLAGMDYWDLSNDLRVGSPRAVTLLEPILRSRRAPSARKMMGRVERGHPHLAPEQKMGWLFCWASRLGIKRGRHAWATAGDDILGHVIREPSRVVVIEARRRHGFG